MENEKIDLNQIQIKDSEFYHSNCKYVQVLKKHNITTVAQLLDNQAMEPIIKKVKYDTRGQLNTFISLLRHKYLNEPLCNDVLFDRNLIITDSGNLRIEGPEKIGFSIDEFFGIPHGRYLKIKFLSATKNEDIYDANFKVIDFIKWLSNFSDDEYVQSFMPTIMAFIESYNDNKKIDNTDFETIEKLKDQLTKLSKTRDYVDEQITNLQEQIEDLSNDINKRGIKR